MPAHLPFATQADEKCAGAEVATFDSAIQHCVRTARQWSTAALVIRAVGPIGSTVILYLLGLFDDAQSMAQAGQLKNVIGLIALIISLVAVTNELFSFQKRSRKYDSGRRALADLDIPDAQALRTQLDCAARGKILIWARENVSVLERLLDEEDIADVEPAFQAARKPLP